MDTDPEISVEQAVAPPPADTDPYAVLRIRDFRVYLIGRFIASTGQQMMLVYAIGYELYHRTNSLLVLSLVGLSQMIPMIACTLPAGYVADNFNRKRVILVTTLVLAAASVWLMLISAWDAPVGWVYCCLFVIGAARTFLWPAGAAFLPHLVPLSLFSRAVIFNSGMFQLSSVLGPTIGGVLIVLAGRFMAHPAATVYAVAAVASLAYFGLVLSIRHEHKVAVREPISFKSLATGFHYVFHNRIILGIITLDMFAVLLGGVTSLLPVYASDILRVGPVGLGILTSALQVGAVVCMLILAHRPPLQKAGRALLWSVVVFGLATIVFGFSKWFWLSVLMMAVCGGVDNVSVVVRQTLVQVLTPDVKRGRVSAVNSLFIGASNQLGEFESCIVAYLFGTVMLHSNAAGSVIAAVSGGVGTIVVVIAVALIWPEIRKYGRLDAA